MRTALIFIVIVALCGIVYATWDETKPADNRAWDLRDDDSRANFAALATMLDISAGATEPNLVTAYNVEAFGADGTDDANDYDAFIDAIQAAGTHGAIYIPAGTYDLDTEIDHATSVVSWIGAGVGNSIIRFGDLDENDAISWGAVGTSTSGVTVRDLSFVTEGGATLSWIEDVLEFNRVHHLVIENVQVACETTRAGIHINGCIYGQINGYSASVIAGIGATGGVAPYSNRPRISLHLDDIDAVMATNSFYISNMRGELGDYIILCDPNDASTPSSNINISDSTFEYAIRYWGWFENCRTIHIEGAYATDGNDDNPLYINGSRAVYINTVRSYDWQFEDVQQLTMENCVFISASDANAVDFSGDNSGVVFKNCQLDQFYALDEIWDVNGFAVENCLYAGSAGESDQAPPISIVPGSKRNLMYNSDLSPNEDIVPSGWSDPATFTWTRVAGRRSGSQGRQVVSSATGSSTFTHPKISEVIEELEDGYGIFRAWIYNTDSSNPYFKVRVVSTAQGNKDWYSSEHIQLPINVTGSWQPVFCPFWVYDAGDVTDIQVSFVMADANTAAFCDPMIVAGHEVPQVFEPSVYSLDMTYTDIVDINNADMNDLATSAYELVAAQGAGTLIEFVSAVLLLDYGSDALTEPSAPDDLAIEYDDGTGQQIITWDTTGFITSSADAIEIVNSASVGGGASAITSAANVNKNIALINTGTDYTGNGSEDTVLRVIVTYRVHRGLGL